MTYNLVWLKSSTPIGTEDFDQLSLAKYRAMSFLRQMNTRFGATGVKVTDESGAPLYLETVRL